jgi:hypothetical protein
LKNKDINAKHAARMLEREMSESIWFRKKTQSRENVFGGRWNSVDRAVGRRSKYIDYQVDRRFSEDLKAELAAVDVPNEVKKIEILEVEELFSYVQKKVEKFTFGLLPVETGIKLLVSR